MVTKPMLHFLEARSVATTRFSSPLLSLVFVLGSCSRTLSQTQPPLPTEATPSDLTVLETLQIPMAPPWLPASTPAQPEWLDTPFAPASPLLRPGLGSASFGDSPLQAVAVIRRGGARGGNGPSPIPLGPVDVGLDVSYGLTYGNGLIGAGNQGDESSIRQTLTPGISLFAGDLWSLRYAPTASFFSADTLKDTLDHAVRLQGTAFAPSWNFGLSHATSIASTPLIETGRQTDQTTHSSGLSAGWDVNGKDTLSFSLSQNLRSADRTPDALSWSNQNWYDRPLTEHISAGLGLGFGYDLLDPGTDMVSERFNGRVQGALGPKVAYSISGGGELRQFLGSDASTKLSPLVSATITYRVLDKTSVFVGLDHSIDTSFFTDQFTQNSSVNGGITQVLTDRWTANASAGFRTSDYQSALTNDLSTRQDTTLDVTFALTWNIFRRLTASVSYSYRSNSSDLAGFDFDSHQFSFRMNYSI